MKKPSDASSNSTPRQPDQPVIFIDEALGRHVIAEALRAAGARVEIHADHFKPGEPDETWLAEMARRGWIVLSKDLRIRYRGLALKVIEDSLARVFVLNKERGPHWTGDGGDLRQGTAGPLSAGTPSPPAFYCQGRQGWQRRALVAREAREHSETGEVSAAGSPRKGFPPQAEAPLDVVISHLSTTRP